MSIKAKVGGEWKGVSARRVKVGDEWKQVTHSYVKVGGEWEKSLIPPLLTYSFISEIDWNEFWDVNDGAFSSSSWVSSSSGNELQKSFSEDQWYVEYDFDIQFDGGNGFLEIEFYSDAYKVANVDFYQGSLYCMQSTPTSFTYQQDNTSYHVNIKINREDNEAILTFETNNSDTKTLRYSLDIDQLHFKHTVLSAQVLTISGITIKTQSR